jgi:hypothetical protein
VGPRVLKSIVMSVPSLTLVLGTAIVAFTSGPAGGSTDRIAKNLNLGPLLITVDKMPTGWTLASSSDALGSGCPKPKAVRIIQNNTVSFTGGNGQAVTEVLRVYSPGAEKGYASAVASLNSCKHDKLAEPHGQSATTSLRQMSLPRFGNKSEAFDAVWSAKGKLSNVYEVVIRSGNIIVTLAERSAGSKSLMKFEDFARLALAKLPFGGTPPIVAGTHVTTTTASPPTTTTTTTLPPPPPTTTTTTRPPPPPPTTTTPPPTTPATTGCYIDPEGNCYRAGEYCPDSLHGQTVQGEDGPITCEDNDGWRWEPA